jgi:RimJ/RimL family protein N-acetyltransferase
MGERPSLETERLLLRPFTLADANDVRRLAGKRAIADTTLNIPHPYEEGMAEEWISTHQESFDQGKGVTFAVTARSDGALMGAISLMAVRAGHQAELGYWIGVPYWNRGFCTEAGHAVLRYAFQDMELLRVHCCHLSRNPSSGRVMQKLGMQYEGRRRQHAMRWGTPEDLELYGIVKEDWKKAAASRPR